MVICSCANYWLLLCFFHCLFILLGKKQPAVTLEQDQSNSDLSPENGDQDGSINQDYIPSTDRDDTPFNDINDIPPTVSAGHNEL